MANQSRKSGQKARKQAKNLPTRNLPPGGQTASRRYSPGDDETPLSQRRGKKANESPRANRAVRAKKPPSGRGISGNQTFVTGKKLVEGNLLSGHRDKPALRASRPISRRKNRASAARRAQKELQRKKA